MASWRPAVERVRHLGCTKYTVWLLSDCRCGIRDWRWRNASPLASLELALCEARQLLQAPVQAHTGKRRPSCRAANPQAPGRHSLCVLSPSLPP